MEDNLESLLTKVNTRIGNGQYFYLSNDPERAIGLENLLKNYHVVHIDKSQYLDDLQVANIPYFCWLEKLPDLAEVFRSSYKLLRSPEFSEYYTAIPGTEKFIQTFKISPAFEKAVAEMGATLINTPGNLNRVFEDKLSQLRELLKLPVSLPKSYIYRLADVSYEDLANALGNSFVVQFDRGHTGSGTVFIESEADYVKLAEEFADRQVRISEKIVGSAYTLNACVLRQGVVLGGLSRQITGEPKLTPQLGGTVGNDWAYRTDWFFGYDEIIKQTQVIGEAMRAQGYLGMFGLDFIVLPDGSFKFIEINARQPASIPMYTKMQLELGQIPLSLLHIAEFLGIDYKIDIAKYNEQAIQPQEYSQIFVRALRPEEIRHELKAGFYRLQGDNAAVDRATQVVRPDTIFLDEERDKALMYYGPGYSLEHADKVGILLLTPVKGRKIKTNDEIGRFQVRFSAFANSTDIKPWIIESLSAVRDYQI